MIGGLFSRRAAIAAATGCSFLSTLGGVAPVAHAAEIEVMSTVALTPTLDELTPKYESSSGNNLMIVYSTIADLKKRIEAGETADVMILSLRRPRRSANPGQGCPWQHRQRGKLLCRHRRTRRRAPARHQHGPIGAAVLKSKGMDPA